jgi:hypothetical protein
LEAQLRPHARRVEAGDVEVERLDARLLPRADREGHGRARARRVQLLAVRDLRAVEAAIAQVRLDEIGVRLQNLPRRARAGLEQVEARANLVGGRAAVGRREFDPHGRNAHLRADDEAQPHGRARVARVRGLDARVRHAPRVEQRLQRLAHAHGRELRVRRDGDERPQIGLRALVARHAFERHLDCGDRPPLVLRQIGGGGGAGRRAARGGGEEQGNDEAAEKHQQFSVFSLQFSAGPQARRAFCEPQ